MKSCAKRQGVGLFLVGLGGVLLITGCSNNSSSPAVNHLTRNRFEMINIGSTDKSQVELALGNPVAIPSRDTWWYSRNGVTATVCFDKDGMVRAKRWTDPRSSEIISEP